MFIINSEPLPYLDPMTNHQQIMNATAKYIEKQNIFLNVEIPIITSGSVLHDPEHPHMLLRQFASTPSYDIAYIINTVIKNSDNDTYKLNLLYEIAQNQHLKSELSGNPLFTNWIISADNFRRELDKIVD